MGLSTKFVFFLKSRLICKIFYCICVFVNKYLINTGAYISKSNQCYNVKHLAYYFYVRTKIPSHFHICISVPLNIHVAYIPFIYIFFANSLRFIFFLPTNSEKCSFNFLKKIQSPWTTQRNVKFTKFSWLSQKRIFFLRKVSLLIICLVANWNKTLS